MQFPDSFFEDEVRSGFYVPALMKRAWAAQIEALAEIARICEKHQIRWFAGCGTLLGVIRHGGFIPWDDDLDIWMLREDYVRFHKIAGKELAEGFRIPEKREGCLRLSSIVWYGDSICLDEKHLKKVHGFPFVVGIDIYPLDYLPSDMEEKALLRDMILMLWKTVTDTTSESQNTQTTQAYISQIEELLRIHIDRDRPLNDQLLALLENIFAMYMTDDSSELTNMVNWVNNGRYCFSDSYFQESLLHTFETMEVPIPKSYHEVLKIHFGEHYMTPSHFGGAHQYPYYRKMEDYLMQQKAGRRLLQCYEFSAGDLIKDKRMHSQVIRPWKQVEDFLLLARRIHDQIIHFLIHGDSGTAAELVVSGQNTAVRIGTFLEQSEKNKLTADVVKLLEEYCEQLYLLYTDISECHLESVDRHFESFDRLLSRMEASARKAFQAPKEIVFLPYKASMWDSLEPAWQAAMADPDYRVYVIPIPYYYKNLDGSLRDMQYDRDGFPDYVPITDYNTYDFEKRQPDVVFIHNPYDACNLTTSVHPFFYASKLKQYTDMLVYTPYFYLDKINPDDSKSYYNMRYYVAMPGLVHADRILLHSEEMRKIYIDYLAGFAGEDTKKIWEEKITVINDFISDKEGKSHALP